MNLRDWRKAKAISADEVARGAGVAASTLTSYENGIRRPRPEIAARIEAFTRGEVTAASLLGLSETAPRKRGLREDVAGFDGASRLTIEVSLPPERAKALRDSGADINAIARAGAEKALKEAEAKAWAHANREAIDAYNIWIDKHGTLAEQFGTI